MGVLISVPVYVLIYRTIPDLKESRKVASHWTANLVGLGFGLFFLIPAIASYISRRYPIDLEECKDYRISSKGRSGRRPQEYYLFVVIQGAEERLTVVKDVWDKYEKGQPVKLCLQKGILGYGYVKLPG